MRKYICYSTDGFTQDMHGEEIENCQILDWVEGSNPSEAMENLLKENIGIEKRYSTFLFQEIMHS